VELQPLTPSLPISILRPNRASTTKNSKWSTLISAITNFKSYSNSPSSTATLSSTKASLTMDLESNWTDSTTIAPTSKRNRFNTAIIKGYPSRNAFSVQGRNSVDIPTSNMEESLPPLSIRIAEYSPCFTAMN